MRGGRAVRAVVVVGALGLGAGTGAVLGLWAGLSWWLDRAGPVAGDSSMLPAASSALVGALVGLLLGTVLAGGAVGLVSGLRRRTGRVGRADGGGPG